MVVIDNIPVEIQISKHSSETENLSFSLFGAEGEVFTTDALKVDGLHYAVLINKEIQEGTYRYQVQKDNHIVEVGLLKYKKPSQDDKTYEGEIRVVFYE